MERQIRSLYPIHDRRRARVPFGLALIPLVVVPLDDDGRRDVPAGSDGGLLRLLHHRVRLGVVGWQGVGAAQVEGSSAAVGPRGRGRADVDFLRGDGAVVADLSGCDAEGFLTEHVALYNDLRVSERA